MEKKLDAGQLPGESSSVTMSTTHSQSWKHPGLSGERLKFEKCQKRKSVHHKGASSNFRLGQHPQWETGGSPESEREGVK